MNSTRREWIAGAALGAAAGRAFAAADSSRPAAKWHPGHYVFADHGAIGEAHLAGPFRGVQRCFAWSRLEPERGRYDVSAVRAGRDRSEARLEPGDETPIPVREHLKLARETLKLNYLFWSASPRERLENVKRMLAEPDLAGDPAGGLETRIPSRAFASRPGAEPRPPQAMPR